MNTKKSVLVLCILLMSSSIYAQKAGIVKGASKTAAKQAGKAVRTVPHATAVLVRPATVSPALKADISKAVQRFSPQERAEMARELKSMSVITGGPDGTTLQRVGDKREIRLSESPSLPNGVDADAMAVVFGMNKGKELLDSSFEAYLVRNPESAKLAKAVFTVSYEEMAERDELWDFQSVLNTAIALGVENNIIPDGMTTMQLYREAPEIFRMVAVLSVREYIIKHGFIFPQYGDNDMLDVYIHGLWRRILHGELPKLCEQELLTDYLYSLNAKSVNEILKEVGSFAKQHGQLPGIDRLLLPAEQVGTLSKQGLGRTLSAQEQQAVSLGMQFVLITHVLPDSPLWDTLPSPTKTRVINWKKQINQAVMDD